MNRSVLIGLAIVLAVALGAVALTADRPGERPAATTERLFPELAGQLASITTIRVERGETRATLTKSAEGAWTVGERDGFPAAPTKLRELLRGLADAKLLEAKTARPDNHAALQLEAPGPAAKSVQVTVVDGAGTTRAALLVGKLGPRISADRDSTFVRRPDEAQTWLVDARLEPDPTPTAWLTRAIADIRQDRIRRVVIEQPGAEPVIAERAKPTDTDLTLLNVPAGKKSRGAFAVNQLAFALESLDLDDVVKAPQQAEGKPAATLESFDGLTVKAFKVDVGGRALWRFEATATPPAALPEGAVNLKPADVVTADAAAFARLNGWLVALPEFKANRLSTPLADLVEPIAPAEKPKAN